MAMRLEQKGHCSDVLLVFIITTVTLQSLCCCEPAAYSSQTTTKSLSHSSNRPVRRREKEWRKLPWYHRHLQTKEQPESSGPRFRPKRVFSSSDKTRFKAGWQWMYSSVNSPQQSCREGEIKHVVSGKFYVAGFLETNAPNAGHQSDSAVTAVQAQTGLTTDRGQRLRGSEDIWQRLHPVVECGDDAMTLTVRRRRAAQLLLDRVNETSLSLSQLPPECGYSVQTRWRDLSVIAPYDACYVTQEDGSYVLPLLWRGIPLKMSCPVSVTQPEDVDVSLCCLPYGMAVKLQGLTATGDLWVKVRDEWTPLILLAEQCGYALERRDAQTLIAIPFIACGVIIKDGRYTLSLQIGERTVTLACPVPEELPQTHEPFIDSPHPARGPTQAIAETLEPILWAPPFYLAPPYYPHPTSPHKYPSPDIHFEYNSPTPPPLTAGTISSSQSVPPVNPVLNSQSDNQDHQMLARESKGFTTHSSESSLDKMDAQSQGYQESSHKTAPLLGLSNENETYASLTSDVPIHVPFLQPPSHVFNPYYHYYHHPKIPLLGAPQEPHLTPDGFTHGIYHEEQPPVYSHNPEDLWLPPSIQLAEGLSGAASGQFHQPVPGVAPLTDPSSDHKAPALRTLYQPQLHPYFYYFPHIFRGEARRLGSLDPDAAAKTNLQVDHENTNSNTFVHPLLHSTGLPLHDVENVNPYKDQQNQDEAFPTQKYSPERFPDSLSLMDGEKPKADVQKGFFNVHNAWSNRHVSVPLPFQTLFQSPRRSNNPHYPYNQPFDFYASYRPESLFGPLSATEAQETLHPQPPVSSPPQSQVYDGQQSNMPPTETVSGDKNNPKTSKSEPHFPFDNSRTGWSVHDPGYHSMLQPVYNRFHSPSSDAIAPQLPYEHHHGAEGGLNHEKKASDCSHSSDCNTCLVKACTVGQYFVFVLPPTVMEPTVVHPLHSSEINNVSCTPVRLTPDHDLYVVPLDGCGVNTHMDGQTLVHLLELEGIHSVQRGSKHESSPVRLMVMCRSSTGSPAEMRLYVMNRILPPPGQSTPDTLTVQLRIAADESFTSYHPEAHLPLSLIRGKPVYLEVGLLEPPEPSLVLLVHSCLAYTLTPYTSWMLVYDGCPGHDDAKLFPSSQLHPLHIRRLKITSFLSLSLKSPSYHTRGRYSNLEDPEIYFLCLTEICSATDGDCTVCCINCANSEM